MKLKIGYILLLVTIVITAHANTVSNPGKKIHFIQKLEQSEKVKIAALGTSLTGTWYYVMQDWLKEAYSDQCTFYDFGVSGSASSCPPGKSGLDQVKKAASYHPDVVFIEFAVNDAYIPYHITVEESRKNLESIIDTMLESNPDIEIILQTMNLVIDVPEMEKAHSTNRAELPEYLKMYRKVAKERKLMLVDHYPNWKRYMKKEGRDAYREIVPDGVHPTAEGYRRILIPELKRVSQ
ncbi:MAG: SGNH/GDSL hydrolase family protein [Bacteroidetes bacterium]|nr:SGNH/GDSL hydrolase family protein [Bacteroidota bacterium]